MASDFNTARQTAASAQSSNWGLSFQEEGKRPVGNATIEELAQYNAFFAEDTEEKKIYLTFDAGFENGNTPAILDAEAEKQAAILRAEAKRESMIREAEGQAEAIKTVQQASADGIRMLNDAQASKEVLQLKSLEAFSKAADGKATKIIIPSEIQGMAGLAKSFSEVIKDN